MGDELFCLIFGEGDGLLALPGADVLPASFYLRQVVAVYLPGVNFDELDQHLSGNILALDPLGPHPAVDELPEVQHLLKELGPQLVDL